MEITQNKYLKFINFSELSLWDIKRYFNDFGLNNENYIKIRDILTPYKKSFNKDDIKNKGYGISKKINFGGELFLRNEEEINGLKGNLFEVPENSIIYSKINVRHGCLYYHKKGSVPFGVSSEYPTFIFDDTKINGEYLQMVLRTQKVKDFLNSQTTGISKARIKVDTFLEIKIPLPSISEQNRIVENYKKNFEKAEKAEKRVEELEKNIENYLMEELGIEIKEKKERRKGLQFVEFKDLDIWNIWNKQVLVKSKKYDFIKIGKSIQSLENTISKVQKNEYLENGKIPIVSQENVLISGYTNKNIKTINGNDLPLVAFGDHSKTVKYIDFEFVCGADGVRLMKPIRDFNIKFYYYYIESVVNFINPTESYTRHWKYLSEINIPLPPLKIQEKIVKHIGEMKDEIKELKEKVVELREGAKEEFEGEIFS